MAAELKEAKKGLVLSPILDTEHSERHETRHADIKGRKIQIVRIIKPDGVRRVSQMSKRPGTQTWWAEYHSLDVDGKPRELEPRFMSDHDLRLHYSAFILGAKAGKRKVLDI